MVLEALAAIGLAGNIVQFVDFSCTLFSQTRQISSSPSGLSSDLDNLITITSSLKDFSTTFSNGSAGNQQDKTHAALQKLAVECGYAAQQLLDVVDRVRSKKPNSKFSSFRACLKGIWSQNEIDRMAKRVDSFRTALLLQIEVMTNANSSTLIKTLNNLQRSSVESTIDLGNQIAALQRDLLDGLNAIRGELLQQNPQGLSRVDSLVSNLLDTEDSIKSTSISISVLRRLWFSGMESRELAIREAHPQSCQQAFAEKIGPWCSSTGPLFWLSGKPGSGKSTMMKFLAEYRGTARALQTWTKSRRLIIASHYFWIGGTKMQRSQQGLLRSILFGILQQEPNLIKSALPIYWNDLDHREEPEDQLNSVSLITRTWRILELEQAFKNLTTVVDSKVCYALFIDGLDEFDGDKDDLISTIKSLASMPNVKMCIASRPWNVFESAFGKNITDKLYLQDLNAQGIRKYVQDNLESLDEFQLLGSEEVQASDITQEIVYEAHGVFLWVFLVVRSLREGIRNFDRLNDLQNRLREFPKDLDAFFRLMFDSMEPIYRKSASRTFQIALTADQPLSLLNYWWADVEETNQNFLFELSNGPVEDHLLSQRKLAITKRINGRLKGLLEARLSAVEGFYGDSKQMRFEFLHRTVRDFLMTKDMTEILSGHIPPTFEPSYVICETMLADLKSNSYWRGSDAYVRGHLAEFLPAAKQYETLTGCSAYHLLLELDSIINHLINQKPPIQGLSKPSDVYVGCGASNIWIHAVAWGLELAVAEWLKTKAQNLSNAQRSNLLHTAAVYLNGENGKQPSPLQFSNISMMNCIWNAIPVALSAEQMENFEDNYSDHALELLLEHGTPLSHFTRKQQRRVSSHQALYLKWI